MKKLTLKILMSATLICTAGNVMAMAEGFYIGVGLGPASNSGASSGKTLEVQVPDGARLSDGTLCTAGRNGRGGFCTTLVKPRSQQFATSIYIGTQFNPYAGVELGGTFFSQVHYSNVFPNVEVTTKPSTRIRTLDLQLKGLLPIRMFNVFGKAGVAFTYVTSSGSLNPSYTLLNPKNPELSRFCTSTSPECEIHYGSTDRRNKYSGIVGFGFSYDIDQNWETDISANALLLGGNIGRINFYEISLSYHFVNKYCGQFLCDD